eukprot:COSAG05_NODE_7971_length_750_cov_1.024578_1_plen_66_part_10
MAVAVAVGRSRFPLCPSLAPSLCRFSLLLLLVISSAAGAVAAVAVGAAGTGHPWPTIYCIVHVCQM